MFEKYSQIFKFCIFSTRLYVKVWKLRFSLSNPKGTLRENGFQSGIQVLINTIWWNPAWCRVNDGPYAGMKAISTPCAFQVNCSFLKTTTRNPYLSEHSLSCTEELVNYLFLWQRANYWNLNFLSYHLSLQNLLTQYEFMLDW